MPNRYPRSLLCASMDGVEWSAYVHIPFCASACAYCAFSIVVHKDAEHERYVKAITDELALREGERTGPVGTLYLGGGTPSRLDPELIGNVIDAVAPSAGAEVTIEMNPDDVNSALIDRLVDVGVNRVSLGVQSTDDAVLAGFRRQHRRAEALRALEVVSSSRMEHVSVDLIFGAAEETSRSWDDSVKSLIDGTYRIDHVSCYALTVEPRTVLHRQYARHPNEESLADRYVRADELLTSAGFANYEISSWARPGGHSRHNLAYWTHVPYVGLGCGAHSFDGGVRSWNHFNYGHYLTSIESGKPAQAGSEVIDSKARCAEAIMFGLRTALGVSVDEVDVPDELLGYFERVDDVYVLNREGRLIADSLIARFI
ncbi:MAG: radical SAM family heme chaperone HemW [Acidimicrobiales bacterium]